MLWSAARSPLTSVRRSTYCILYMYSSRLVLSLADLLGRRTRIPPDDSKGMHPARQGFVRDGDEVPNRKAVY